MPLKSFHSLASLAALAAITLGASLLAPLRVPAPAAAGHAGPHLPPALHGKLAGEAPRRYDRPDEALELYRRKRVPVGETEIPVERYFQALETMRFMAQHSTVRDATGSLGAWTSLGPGNIGGRTRALIIDPVQPSTLYAAAAAGGLWKSTDGGSSWSPLGDLLPNLAVSSLAIHPLTPGVLYAGTGEGFFNLDGVRGAGIFKTVDGGVTWSRLAATNTADFFYVNDIVISAARNMVYAATAKGVFRSANGGATWTKIYSTSVTGGCLDLALRTDQPADILFASCGTFVQASVVRNTAAQASGAWTTVLRDPGMGRTSLAIAPSNRKVIYALAASNKQGSFNQGLHGVFRSTDGGGSWTAQVRNTNGTKLNRLLLSNPVIANLVECEFGTENFFFNQGWYDNVIAVDPQDPNRVWVGGIDLFRSDDAGKSWGLASYWWAFDDQGSAPSYAHADQHALAFHPGYNGTTNRTLYAANDGGVFRTANARAATARGSRAVCHPEATPLSWVNLNNGYAVTQFYHGTPYPDGATYFGGTQDNGTDRGTDAAGPDAWQQILGGDGGFVAIDPGDTETLYAENTALSIARSTDGGAHWEGVSQGIDPREEFLFITPFVMDPSNARRLWLGGGSLWRTTNGAASWQKASRTVPGEQIHSVSALSVDPGDPNHLLAGTVEGFLLRNDAALAATGTTAWPSKQPQKGYVSSVTISPASSSVVYATYSTFGTVHVWKSVDGGTIWSPLPGTGAGKLPDVPAHALVVDPAHPDHLYLATDLGVFASLDGGQHWLVENTGFANVSTAWLEIRRDGSRRTLFAFSHGRGAWKVELPD